jgi:hypothetical protein
MKLKAMYESLADVPAEFKDAFTEEDGKAVLSGEIEVKTEADVKAVLEAKDHVKAELAEAKEKLKSFDGLDKTKFEEMQNELDLLRAKSKEGGSDEETINAIVKAKLERATEQMTAENKELREKLEKEQGFRFNNELEAGLRKALEGKVDALFIDDAMALNKGFFKREANGEYLTKDGLSISDAVSKFVESKPHFAPRNSGGGAQGGANEATATKKESTMLDAVNEAWGN